jgi:hypothetical protein
MSVPNKYQFQWFKDPLFLQGLINTAQTAMETQFPFPTLKANHFHYKLDPESIFFNYTINSNYFYHRINLTQVLLMEPVTRIEHLDQTTPRPTQYHTCKGTVYDACYDVAFIVSHVNPMNTVYQPKHNEQLLIRAINDLVITRTDPVAVVAKILTIYHDYRVAELRPPQAVQHTNIQQVTPQHVHPAHIQATTQQIPPCVAPHIVVNQDAVQLQRTPQMPYVIPQHRKTGQGILTLDQLEDTVQKYTHPTSRTRESSAAPKEIHTTAKRQRKKPQIINAQTPWEQSRRDSRIYNFIPQENLNG